MKVTAKEMGYYDLRLRREGDEFEIEGPQSFSFRWMTPVDDADWKEIKKWCDENPKVKRYEMAFPVELFPETADNYKPATPVRRPSPSRKKKVSRRKAPSKIPSSVEFLSGNRRVRKKAPSKPQATPLTQDVRTSDISPI